MLGDIEVRFSQTTLGAGSVSSSASHVLRYEVVGLMQTEESDKIKFDIDSSRSVFINVLYSRMNEEM